MSCPISANIAYFIGNNNNIETNKYITTGINTDYMNLTNLVASYYPLYYQNINNLYNIFGNNTQTCYEEKNNIQTNLSKYISIINNKNRIYNINNINILTYVIIFYWIVLLLLIMRYIYIQLPIYYIGILLFILIIILLISSLWSLYVFNQNI